jgi:hypothetical protein
VDTVISGKAGMVTEGRMRRAIFGLVFHVCVIKFSSLKVRGYVKPGVGVLIFPFLLSAGFWVRQ